MGGRGTVDRADILHCRSPCPGCARTSGATVAILSPARMVSAGSGPPPDQVLPPYHSGNPAPDVPTSHPSAGNGKLSGDDAVGGRDRLLLRFLSRRKNHRPLLIGFDTRVHLSGGDVTITHTSGILQVFLKRSETDQYGRGTEVFIGTSANDLCPVEAVCAYVASHGMDPGALFSVEGGAPLTKARFVVPVCVALTIEQEYQLLETPGIVFVSARQRWLLRPDYPVRLSSSRALDKLCFFPGTYGAAGSVLPATSSYAMSCHTYGDVLYLACSPIIAIHSVLRVCLGGYGSHILLPLLEQGWSLN